MQYSSVFLVLKLTKKTTNSGQEKLSNFDSIMDNVLMKWNITIRFDFYQIMRQSNIILSPTQLS